MENNETTVNLNGLGHRTLKTHREWKIMNQGSTSTEWTQNIKDPLVMENNETGGVQHEFGHRT